jgi:zinc protease
VDTLSRLQRDDLVRFYQRHYAAPYAVVAIMGNVGREEAEAIAEQLTAGLPKTSAAAPQIPPVPALETGIERIIAHPATQSHILIGAPGVRRDDPDYFPLFVGNYILGGGGFVSRLIEEVRSKRGLAYSAYSYFAPQARKGPFIIGLQTRRDQATESLSVVRETLSRFLTDGPTEAELRAAKNNIIGGFPMRIDSNRKMHGYLGMIGFYRLPLTYLEDFVPNIDKVTVGDIRSAFGRRVDADRLVTVVVAADGKPAPARPAP